MNSRARSLLLLLPLLAACDRGPEIPPNAEAPSGPVAAPRAMPGVMPGAMPGSAQAMPAGHPTTGAMPGAGAMPGGPEIVAPPRPTLDPANPVLAGVAWSAADGLTWRTPSNNMRAAEYVATGPAGEAELTVYFFPGMGGSIDDNVQRWVGQFVGADGQPLTGVQGEPVTLAGLSGVKLDVSGTYGGMGGGGTPNQRLLGLIVQAPTGPVFFKFVGPAATVAAAQPAFNELVNSIHPAH